MKVPKHNPEYLRTLFAYHPQTGEVYRIKKTANCVNVGDVVGSLNGRNYLTVEVDDVTYQLHRVIFALVNGVWPSLDIDHINGVGYDNRWSNLREVSHSLNMRNAKQYATNSTGVRGVYPYKGKFRAQKTVNGTKQYLGTFNTIEAAARAIEELK